MEDVYLTTPFENLTKKTVSFAKDLYLKGNRLGWGAGGGGGRLPQERMIGPRCGGEVTWDAQGRPQRPRVPGTGGQGKGLPANPRRALCGPMTGAAEHRPLL